MLRDTPPSTPPAFTSWVPFTIPQTPNVGPNDNYALFAKQGAVSGKNPSQFLEWQQTIPNGTVLNQLLRWNPSAVPNGAWVRLNPPSTQDASYLKHEGQNLSWDTVVPDGTEMGDLLKWDPSAGNDGAWVVLNSPNASPEEPQYLKHNGSDAYWDQAILPEGNSFGDLLQWDPNAGENGAWIVLEAPTGDNKFLYFKDDSWQVVEAIEFDVCENGEPKTYKIPAIPVEE
jgi:hypothetical protein